MPNPFANLTAPSERQNPFSDLSLPAKVNPFSGLAIPTQETLGDKWLKQEHPYLYLGGDQYKVEEYDALGWDLEATAPYEGKEPPTTLEQAKVLGEAFIRSYAYSITSTLHGLNQVGEEIEKEVKKIGTFFSPAPGKFQRAAKFEEEYEPVKSELGAWYEKSSEMLELEQQMVPEFYTSEQKGFGRLVDMVYHPGIALYLLANSLPQVIAATGAGLATGGGGGAAVFFGAGWGPTYRRNELAGEKNPFYNAFLTSIEAAITAGAEMIPLGEQLKILKETYSKGLTHLISADIFKRFAKMPLAALGEEAIQHPVENYFISRHDPEQELFDNFWDQAIDSMTAETLIGLMFGISGGVSGIITKKPQKLAHAVGYNVARDTTLSVEEKLRIFDEGEQTALGDAMMEGLAEAVVAETGSTPPRLTPEFDSVPNKTGTEVVDSFAENASKEQIDYIKKRGQEHQRHAEDLSKGLEKLEGKEKTDRNNEIGRELKRAELDAEFVKKGRKQRRDKKVTKSQLASLHILPKRLGMTEKQRRAFMKKLTGKDSAKDLTLNQADKVLNKLKELSRDRVAEKAQQKEQRKQYKTPTLTKYFTAQDYYSELLGLSTLLRPLIRNHEQLQGEAIKLMKKAHKWVERWDKEQGTTLKERMQARLINVSTKAEELLAHLMNSEFSEGTMDGAYKGLDGKPHWLNPEERKILMEYRALTQGLFQRFNEARQRMGLEPVKYVKGYFTHVLNEVQKAITEGSQDIPTRIFNRGKVGKIIHSPRAEERKLGRDLKDLFSSDPKYAMDTMIWSTLRYTYLQEPLKQFYEDVKRDQKVIPGNTLKWAEDFVREQILGQKSDTSIDEFLRTGKLHDWINNEILKPFGRRLSDRPWTNLMDKVGQSIMAGVLGPRPKILLRNLTQKIQVMALYGPKVMVQAIKTVPGLCQELIDTDPFVQHYVALEELPIELLGKLQEYWHRPYQWTALSNVKFAMRAAFIATQRLITDPAMAKYGWRSVHRSGKEAPGFFYEDEIQTLRNEMRAGASATQYHYIATAMPQVFRYRSATPLTRLQSWWMNHIFRFHREAFRRLVRGTTIEGKKLPWSYRANYLKYLTLGGTMLNTLGYSRSFIFGVWPTALPPIARLVSGLYFSLAGTSDRDRKEGRRAMSESWMAMMPGYLFAKDFLKFIKTGDWEELWFYNK